MTSARLHGMCACVLTRHDGTTRLFLLDLQIVTDAQWNTMTLQEFQVCPSPSDATYHALSHSAQLRQHHGVGTGD